MGIDVATTKMSSKGQIVIPAEMREDFADGTKFIIIRNNDQIILKKSDKTTANFEGDLKFAKSTEKAFIEYMKGNSRTMESKDFLKAMKKW